MAKKELTISQFRGIIKEEALKLKKRITLENEKKALKDELKNLNEGMYEEEDLEESWWNVTQGGEDSFMNDLKTKIISLKRLGGQPVSDEKRQMILSKAKSDNFGGKLQITKKGPEGELVYIPSGEAKSSGPGVTSISR